ncbi:MAG: LysM peptidoglycan-binding domain-containing protein [Thermoleophilia bacterium]|nr:LysM peptidoglycan-binding domain-containing protein [Thermoleophilia bacterium]
MPRVLAPLAFFTAATVLVVLVNSSLKADPERGTGATTPAGASARGTSDETTTGRAGKRQRRFYRIKEGDTLEAVAARFDTTVDDLLRLNRGIDATTLTPGQRIRVR